MADNSGTSQVSKKGNKKKSTKTKGELRTRWTEEEINAYALVLADPVNQYCISLEKLAMKKSSYNDVFEFIKRDFDMEINDVAFKSVNEKCIKGTYKKLDTSIEKLRQKYKSLKTEWSAKTTRARNGSGLEPDKEPRWYQVLNPALAETHKPCELASSSLDTSYGALDENNDEEVDTEELNNDINESLEDEDDDDGESAPPNKRRKLVAAPHKKMQAIRSNKQGLASIAQGIKDSIAAQNDRHKKTLKFEEEREKRMLEFRKSETAADRAHEMRMAELFLSYRQPAPQPHPQFQLQGGNPFQTPRAPRHDPYQPEHDSPPLF